jgi:hypothetical protein
MKKIAVLSVILGLAAPCIMAADIQVGYSGSGYGQWQTGQGGEFTLTPSTTPTSLNPLGVTLDYAGVTRNIGQSGSFQTFCIEENEYIYPYNRPAQGTLSDAAIYGGVGGRVGSPGNTYDPLSVGTAWLYKQFAEGTLDGYDYTTVDGRHASASQLQQAIWWLEEEVNLDHPAQNIFAAQVLAIYGGEVGARANNVDSTGHRQIGVMVLNLTYDDGQSVGQDQLVSIPDGGMTLMLLGLGFSGLAVIRRKVA